MDFHGLPRKQLQALCKQNKIPANMTNVAMADALSALDHVDGLEEALQPQSARKAEAGSPEVPRTGTRISTRARKLADSSGTVSQSGDMTSGKVVDDDADNGSPEVPRTGTRISTRARRVALESHGKVSQPGARTSRKLMDDDAEPGSPEVPRSGTRTSTRTRKAALESHGKVSQPGARTSRKLMDDDEGEDEKKEVGKTPAVASRRKCAPAAASRRKMEVPSLQKTYSIRRSVRLAESKLAELCLEESGKRNQPIKIDDELSSEITESDVKGEDASEQCAEEALDNYEVNSCQMPAQLVVAVDSAAVVPAKLVSSNGITDKVATEVVEKAIAVEAVQAMGRSGAVKDLEIVSNGVSIEPAQLVDAVDNAAIVQVSDVSNNGITREVAFEVVEKAIDDDFAKEEVQAMDCTDAEKKLKIVCDDVSVEVPPHPADALDSATAVQVSDLSNNGITNEVAVDVVEKSIDEDFEEEEVQAMGSADADKKLEIASDVVSVEVPSHLVDAVDRETVVQANEVSSNGITEVVATVGVEKAAGDAVEAMGSTDTEKDLEIGSDGVSGLGTVELSDQIEEAVHRLAVDQVNEVSSNGTADEVNEVSSYGINDVVATEDVGKAEAKGFATDGVSGLVTVEVVDEATPEMFGEQTLLVSVVTCSPGASEILEIAADGQELGTVSDELSDLLVKEEVALKSSANHEIEDGSDELYDLVEAPLKSLADLEKTETAADKADLPEDGDYDYLNRFSAVKDVIVERTASQSPQLVVAMEETLQVDECDYDADSMTCQLGSPYHLADLLEVAANDIKPQDPTNTEEHMENVQFCVDDKEALLDCSEPIPVEVKPDTERSITEEDTTTMTPLSIRVGNPVLGTSPYPKAQRSVQRSAIREAPSTDHVNKENIVAVSLVNDDTFKKPQMSYDTMSMRQLRKMVKAMKISAPDDIEEEDDTNKNIVKPHQDTPRPRQALKTLPDNTRI